MRKIAVFVSGSGTNCENIIRYFSNSDKGRVALVVSNREDAYALVRAANLNVPSVVVNKSQLNDESYLMPILNDYGIDFIVLAGFLCAVILYKVSFRLLKGIRASKSSITASTIFNFICFSLIMYLISLFN